MVVFPTTIHLPICSYAYHVGSISEGWVIARCEPVHLGKNTHVVDIAISAEDGRKISVCRLTNMIIEK